MEHSNDKDGVEFVPATVKDAESLASKIFSTFENVHKARGGTTSDWTSLAVTRDFLEHMLENDSTKQRAYRMVAKYDHSIEYGFWFVDCCDSVTEVGPIVVFDGYQGKGRGKQIMAHLLETSNRVFNQKVLVLVQDLFNPISLSLYISSGFHVRDTIAQFRLWDTKDSIPHSAASQFLENSLELKHSHFSCRRMTEDDISHCSSLSTELCGISSSDRIGRFFGKGSKDQLSMDFRAQNLWVCETTNYSGRRDIVGYTTGFTVSGHTIARNEYVAALLAESFLNVASKLEKIDNPLKEPFYAHVPLRYTQLMLFFLANDWKIGKNVSLMSTSATLPVFHVGVVLPSAGGR